MYVCIYLHTYVYIFYIQPFCDDISVGARDLIRHMLCTDPQKRPSASECLRHVWLQEVQIKREVTLNETHRAFCKYLCVCVCVCVCVCLLVRRLALFDQLDPYIHLFIYTYL
jgi:serine/threonine protein kinase